MNLLGARVRWVSESKRYYASTNRTKCNDDCAPDEIFGGGGGAGQRILHDVVGLLNLSVNHGFFLVFSGITLFFNNSVDTGTGKMHCRPEIFFVAKQK